MFGPFRNLFGQVNGVTAACLGSNESGKAVRAMHVVLPRTPSPLGRPVSVPHPLMWPARCEEILEAYTAVVVWLTCTPAQSNGCGNTHISRGQPEVFSLDVRVTCSIRGASALRQNRYGFWVSRKISEPSALRQCQKKSGIQRSSVWEA